MSYAALRDKKQELIRKAKDGSSYIAPFSAPAIGTLTRVGADEVQSVTITGGPTGGTFTLTFSAQTTAAIPFNATSSAVETALRALSTIGAGGVSVSGGPGPGTAFQVTFIGYLLSGISQPLMTASAVSLTGGTTPAVVIAQVTDGGTGTAVDLRPLPSAYTDAGWCADAGHTYGRTTELSEVQSFGSVEPTRSDVTRDSITHQVTMQETKLLTMGLVTGADISGVTADVTTGEVRIAKPSRPSFKYYRVLSVFVDDGDDGEIYIARWSPRARVTEVGDEVYSDGDDPIQYPITFTSYEDSDLGYSHQWMWGGAGWKALLAEMGLD